MISKTKADWLTGTGFGLVIILDQRMPPVAGWFQDAASQWLDCCRCRQWLDGFRMVVAGVC
jgi:hypothetical protein